MKKNATTPNSNKGVPAYAKRFRIVYYIAFTCAILLMVKMISLQFFSEDPARYEDFFHEEVIEPSRGKILSHDDRTMAMSIPYYILTWDSTRITDSLFKADVDSLALCLSKLYKDKSQREYKRILTNARNKKSQFIYINKRKITYREYQEAIQFPIFRLGRFKGGFKAEDATQRKTPYDRLAYRTVGYIRKNEHNAEYGVGLESSFNQKLKGKPGIRTITRDLNDQWVEASSGNFLPAQDGYDLRTTLDIEIQEAAEIALREQLAQSDLLEGATAIVMDVKTGAIRAMANMKKDRNGNFDESYNYAIAEANDPGSTFKLVTLVALLEDGLITLDTPVDAGNGRWKYSTKEFTDSHTGGYGMLTALTAFEKSSNIAFAKLVTQYYKDNEEQFIARIHSMKVGEKIGFDIEGEATARIPSPTDRNWSALSMPMISMGYELAITPLHTLTFYNAIANGGKMMKPYLAEALLQDGEVVESYKPTQILGSVCSKKTLREAQKAMEGVVKNGTAKGIQDERYGIAGKTGTAQILFDGVYKDALGYRKHQASFAGYFPTEDPKYSCIVVLYSNKTRGNFYGAQWAAPVFKKISDFIYNTHPEWHPILDATGQKPADHPSIANGQGQETLAAMNGVPLKQRPAISTSQWIQFATDSTGMVANTQNQPTQVLANTLKMGLKDALFVLENQGCRVKFEGQGRVIHQEPAPGTPLRPKQTVTLTLSNQ